MLKNIYRIFFLALFSTLVISCGSGGGEDNSNDSTVTTYNQTNSNFYAGDTYDKSELSIDADGNQIIRTKLSILFKSTASETEVEQLLTRINATITSSVAGARSVSIRIPDSGTIASLDVIIADIESESFVDAVLKSAPKLRSSIPDNIIEENENDYEIIDNSLAIGGSAAWNAKEASTTSPNVIIMDYFGRGASQLNAFLDATLTGTVLNVPPKPDDDDHGYHVAGILAGSYGGGTSVAGLVTGILPNHSKLHIIDIVEENISSDDLDALLAITAASMSGTIVYSTSLGDDCSRLISFGACQDREEVMIEAIKWIDLVRSAGLETKMFHATAAGNRDSSNGGDYSLRDTQTQSNYSAAATMAGITSSDGSAVPNLTNMMAVENLRGSDTHPREIRCLDENSFIGGDIAGIGTNVTSLLSTGTAKYSGTSMATPQIAGLAAYLLSIDSSLSPQRIKDILFNTSQATPSEATPDCSNWGSPAPSIDAYAAVLALDKEGDSPVRNAILDIVGGDPNELGENSKFDENDLIYYIEQIETGSDEKRLGDEKVKYSRADLNGDGYDGGDDDYQKKFNLDMDYPPSFTTVTQIIEDEEVEYDENFLTDNDILCYYAYSDLYTGSTTERKNLMSGRCKSGRVAVYYSHVNNISFPGESCNGNLALDIDEQRENFILLEALDNFIDRPSNHYWFSGDFDIERMSYSEFETSGFYLSNGSCVDRSFTGKSELDSTISHAVDTSRIEIDITATAASNCYDITDSPSWECNDANAVTSWIAHYDYKIKAATTLKVILDLACTGPNLSPPGYPDVANPLLFPPIDLRVSLLRTDRFGNDVPQHQDPEKLFFPTQYYCNDTEPDINEEILLEFDAPEIQGNTDYVTIMIMGNSGATGNLGNANTLTSPPLPIPQNGELGLQTNESTMFGFVEVVPAN